MEILLSRRRIAGTLLRSAILCVSLTLLAGLAGAQKTTNPDGSTTTTTRDDTYGKGGTRETTTSGDGTVTREVEKDGDGRPMHATEKDKNGNTQTEIFWKYDKGRVEEVSIRTKKRQWFAVRHYKDAKDDTGKARYMVSDFDTDDWEITSGAPEMESILKKFGLVLWPEVVHLTAGPGPKDTPPKANDNPKQQVPEKTSFQSDSSAATNAATAQLIGVVYDKDSRPGEPVTVSLTTEPKKYADIPGLGVVEVEVPAAAGASGQAVLQGLVVDTGDGRVHRGDEPFTVLVANAAAGIPILFGQSASLLLGSTGNVSKTPTSVTTDGSTDHKYPTTPTPTPTTVGDPDRTSYNGGTRLTWHDAQGRIVKVEDIDKGSNLRSSETTEYVNGGQDKKSNTYVAYDADGVKSTTITEWDGQGGYTRTTTERDGTKTESSYTPLQGGGSTTEATTYDPKGRVTDHQTLTSAGGVMNGRREMTTYSGDNDQKGTTVVDHYVPGVGWVSGPGAVQGPVIVAPLIPLPPATTDESGKTTEPGTQPPTISPLSPFTPLPGTEQSTGPTPGITIPVVPPGTQPAPPLIIQSVNTGKPADFYTPPVVQNTSVIHGPLSGNAQQMRITVDNQPARVVTATPRSVFFDLPLTLTAGPHTLTLQDGQRSASAPIVKLGLVMKADQLQLQRGQSTNYSATVLLGPLPDSVWQHGGTSPELVNASEITKLAPGFQVPQAGQPGSVLFHLENDSRQTVTIKPSQNETITRVLNQQNFQGGQFIEAGMIQSKQSGGFDIKATVQTFFAPIQFSEPNNVALNEGTARENIGEHPSPVIAEETQHKPCTGTCDKPVEGKSSDPWKPETYMSCKACSTCTQQNCGCNLWKRKGGTPPGGMYPDWEFEAQQGKQAEKDATYEYSCFCTQ
jgi:hypothetical protein